MLRTNARCYCELSDQMLRVAVVISSGKLGIIAADLVLSSDGSIRITGEIEQYAKKRRTKQATLKQAALRVSYFKHQTDTGLPCKGSDFRRALGLTVFDIVDPLVSLSDEMFQTSRRDGVRHQRRWRASPV